MATEVIFPLAGKRVWVAGHNGMVGGALVRRLASEGCEVLIADRKAVDLTNQAQTHDWVQNNKPDAVFLAAAKVGGIHANNTYPADFIYENLMVQVNVIKAAHRNGVQKLLSLGSSCIYPRLAPQPMAEDALLTGTLEPTNEPYAVAKIAGIKLCESYNRQYGRDYRSVMPTNLYGPGDNYHPENSHVIPALLRRFHEAKVAYAPEVAIWGTGTPRREFLYVDDMAAASVFVMNMALAAYQAQVQPQLSHINVGYGSDVTIAELAQTLARVVGYATHAEVQALVVSPAFQTELARLRALRYADAAGVMGLKLPVLRLLHSAFRGDRKSVV
jgi:GDP-L-fucose synthase